MRYITLALPILVVSCWVQRMDVQELVVRPAPVLPEAALLEPVPTRVGFHRRFPSANRNCMSCHGGVVR